MHLKLMVEATCLTWIEVNLDANTVTRVRVQGAPENVVIPAEPDVVSVDPDEQVEVTATMREKAVSLARQRRLPDVFELTG